MRLNLTDRDLKIVQAIKDGQSNEDIAKSSGAKADTVRDQVDDLKQRLGVQTRDEIVAQFRSVTGWANEPKDYGL